MHETVHSLNEGTVDCFLFDRTGGDLYLWDYKFGYLVVEAFENWQVINYTAGIVELFNIDGIEDQNITVHLRIVQPCAHHVDGPIRTWSVKLSDLRAYFNVLKSNAAIAMSNDSVIRSGSHCVYCTARVLSDASIGITNNNS